MLDEFLAEIKTGGIARPNLFKVEIIFPQQIRNGFTEDFFEFYGISPQDGFRVNLFCETTELPGRSIQSTPIKTHGPPIKTPYNALYDDVPMTFYVGGNMKEKKFFDAWQRMIVDPNTGDLNYYNEYTTSIKITQLTDRDEEAYSIKLKNAWPAVISPVGLGQGEENQIMRLPITFAYSQWEFVPSTGETDVKGFGDVLNNAGPISNKLDRALFDVRQLNNPQITNVFNVVKGVGSFFNTF